MTTARSILQIFLGAAAMGACATVFFLDNSTLAQHSLASATIIISLFVLKTAQKPY